MSYKILWRGFRKQDGVKVVETASRLNVSPEDKKAVEENWEKVMAGNPHAFDGLLWRYEGLNSRNGDAIELGVSQTRYRFHAVMRKTPDREISYYPNPASINAVVRTADNDLLVGAKGKIADQTGLGMVGGVSEQKGRAGSRTDF